MSDRREFLRASALGASALLLGSGAGFMADPTWLTYAPSAELFWRKLPYLERLKKIAEAGFNRYEFGLWKTKDIDAIIKANEELTLQTSQFLAYSGFANPKRKDAFLEEVEASVEVAKRFNTTMISVIVGDMVNGIDREEQVDGVIEALKAAVEKVNEAEVTLLVKSTGFLVDRPKPLLPSVESLAEVVKAVDSKFVKILFDLHQEVASGVANPAESIQKHKDLIGYYQLADHPGRHEPGTGKVDFAKVLQAIHQAGQVELVGLEMAPLADPVAAIKSLRDADARAKAL